MRRFHTTTLGCKINQYETQAIAESWIAGGGVAVDDPAEADLLLVNSCAVTAGAVADLRKAVRRLHRENPQADIVITGCAAQVLAGELASLPGVTRVVPQERKADLLRRMDDVQGREEISQAAFAITDYPRARAVAMVQDGCSHRCTYCIVPLTRGPSRSREPGAIEAEIARLVEAGFAEVVLSGVNLRQFGRELSPRLDFWDLLERLERAFAHLEGRLRFRISSLEPGQLGPRALEVLGSSRLVAPQLHLSLQSGDPDVLRLMGRGHYSPGPLLGFLRELGARWPLFGLGADILVGFPGETRQRFENTLAYVRELPLSYAHVFPYSPRPGTPAETMDGQVDPAERRSRAAEVRGVAAGKKRRFLQRVAGLDRVWVVVQDAAGSGVSEYYASCRFTNPAGLASRQLVEARPVGLEGQVVLVEPAASARGQKNATQPEEHKG
jgi:MiaB/RimO family radical SAM methylthiotransferase